MTRLDFNAFSTPELEDKLQGLKVLLASGTLTDRSALNQFQEIAGLQAELERRGGRDVVATSPRQKSPRRRAQR